MHVRHHVFSDASALSLGLAELVKDGLTPRGLLFLALEPNGLVHLVTPEEYDDISRMRVGDKLALHFSLPGRFYHFDAIHRLRAGQFLYNGDRRLVHPGNATDVAGAVTVFLKNAGARNVFFGCTPHQPGSWIASKLGTETLHDAGFVESVVVEDGLVLARRIMDHHLWLLAIAQRFDAFVPVYESPFGNILMLERRVVKDRLVLTCEEGYVELELSKLPTVKERAREVTYLDYAVVGRMSDQGFAVTHGRKEPWGLDDMKPAILLKTTRGSLSALGRAIDALPE